MTGTRTSVCFAFALFVGLLTQSTSAVSDSYSPVEKTWFYGTYIFPAEYMKSGSQETFQQSAGQPVWTELVAEALKPDAKVPVVVYMHGCAGFGNQGEVYRDLLLEQGYAFFIPDSFQRPGRNKCAAEGALENRVAMRSDELAFALREIQKLPWVDTRRLVLMGFSEGGNAVDSWSKAGFAAHIIISSACTLVGGVVAAPPEIPVLAIVGGKDDYRPGQSCDVNRTVGGSKSIVIPGRGHSIAQYDETRNGIKAFLAECCAK